MRLRRHPVSAEPHAVPSLAPNRESGRGAAFAVRIEGPDDSGAFAIRQVFNAPIVRQVHLAPAAVVKLRRCKRVIVAPAESPVEVERLIPTETEHGGLREGGRVARRRNAKEGERHRPSGSFHDLAPIHAGGKASAHRWAKLTAEGSAARHRARRWNSRDPWAENARCHAP